MKDALHYNVTFIMEEGGCYSDFPWEELSLSEVEAIHQEVDFQLWAKKSGLKKRFAKYFGYLDV